MAEDQDHSSKSEEPSDRKLQKARERGEVPLSREVGHFAGFAALLALVWLAAGAGLLHAANQMGGLFASAGQLQIGGNQSGMADLAPILATSLGPAASLTAGGLGVLFLGGALVGLLQGPLVVAGERVRPKLERLSPARGLVRLISLDHLVDFGKSLLKLSAIGVAGFSIVGPVLRGLLPGAVVEAEWLPGLVAEGAERMLLLVTLLMLPVAVVDLAWKRLRYLRQQRMTLQEVRDEYKDAEGDPHVAAKRAQTRRQRARQRIQRAVPTATLVVTNPTHYAVALRYERGVDAAPVCVAKGTDRIAARIRQIAHESSVPVIESPALARTLYANVEIDQAIPEAHWQAVARLVTYVLDLRRRIRRKAPDGSRLRGADEDAELW